MSEKTDELIARAVPKIAASGKLDSFKRKVARFAARAWVKGPDKLAALGAKVSSKAHAAALEAAETSEDDEEGAFLADVRKAVHDDDAFVTLVKAFAKAYAAAAAKKKEGAGSGRHAAQADSAVKRRASSRRARIVVAEEEPEPARVDPPGAISESTSGEGAADAGEELALEVPEDDDEVVQEPLGIRMDAEEAPAPPTPKAKPGKDAAGKAAPGKGGDGDVRKAKGDFKRIELEDPGEIEIMVAMAPSGAKATAPVADVAPAPSDEGPDAAAARSIERYKKDGDPGELANARKLYKLAVEKAPAGPAKAAARAGVGLTSLLAGQDDEAKKNAEKALAEDPLCALAISVLARAKRGEGVREKIRAGIARARIAFKTAKLAEAGKHAAALEKEAKDEPFAKLIQIALAAESGDGIDTAIQDAWKLYPSPKYPDLALGEPLDARVARAAAAWGAAQVEKGGPDALVQTQRKLEEKDNVLAGAFQIAIGVARCAIATRADMKGAEEQELRTAVGDGLLGLQYFDAAAAMFDKAFSIDRSSGFALECKKGTERSQVMRRAFDKPGIKARLGSFEGVGAMALKKAVGARVAGCTTEKEAEESALLKDEIEAVKALAASAERRKKVEARAKKGGKENPLAALVDVEQQVKELDAQKTALGAKEPEKKGFLGRAFDKVKDTAKGAQLAVKKQMVESKLAEAHKAVARKLRDAPDDGWADPVLDQLAKRGSSVEAKLEHLEDELLQAKKVVARIGEL
jgi:tetratricopeptide (TPR) repeat protein